MTTPAGPQSDSARDRAVRLLYPLGEPVRLSHEHAEQVRRVADALAADAERVNSLVRYLVDHRRATLRALRAHPSGSGGDYWRWQGHAELSRQLLTRLGAEVPQ